MNLAILFRFVIEGLLLLQFVHSATCNKFFFNGTSLIQVSSGVIPVNSGFDFRFRTCKGGVLLSQQGTNNGFFVLEVVPTIVNYSSTPSPLFIRSHLKMTWNINGEREVITLGTDLDKNFLYKVLFIPGYGATNSTLRLDGLETKSVDISNSILGFQNSGPLMAGHDVTGGEGFVGCIISGTNIQLIDTGPPGSVINIKKNCPLDKQLGCPKKVCSAGFTGYYCEVNIDDCAQALCHDYSTCIDLIGNYSCSCGPRWTGRHCDVFLGSLAPPTTPPPATDTTAGPQNTTKAPNITTTGPSNVTARPTDPTTTALDTTERPRFTNAYPGTPVTKMPPTNPVPPCGQIRRVPSPEDLNNSFTMGISNLTIPQWCSMEDEFSQILPAYVSAFCMASRSCPARPSPSDPDVVYILPGFPTYSPVMVKVRLYIRLSTGGNSSVVMDLGLVTNFLGAFSRNVSEMFGGEFAVDGGFTEWSPWGPCSSSCEIGTQVRHRNCTNPPPINNGSECTGSRNQIQRCYSGLCPDINCTSLTVQVKGPLRMSSCGNHHGAKCSFSCAIGYQLIGPTSVTCVASSNEHPGVWNDTIPTCKAITCQALPSLSDGVKEGCTGRTTEDYGTVCRFSCKEGYEASGSNERSCQENGAWSGEVFSCQKLNRVIREKVTITEGETRTLNCTKEFYDGRSREWSRKDRRSVFNKRRVLTEDDQLQIINASFVDAGVYICVNAPQIRHEFNVSIRAFIKVEMVVRVLNYEYSPELKNKTSPVYKSLEQNFTTEMDKVYNNTPGYVRTEVLNFTKGSVKVDFRVIIVIVATDPKNATTIPDKKAQAAHRVVVEAKDGFVKQLQVDPNVEVKTPPLEPRGVEIFDKESNELSVRWSPPEDSDAFKVEEYVVQHREFKATVYTNASFPATKDKDTYSLRIQNLEPETTYMIRVGARNKYGSNFNEEEGHETLDAPFAKWIIAVIVLAIVLVLGIIVGVVICMRKRAEERRRKLEEEEGARFGGLVGDVRMNSVSHYEERKVKGIKFSYTNDAFKPTEVKWKEIPYEDINLLNELGSGAFGVVYKGELARDKCDATPCAVKALKASATNEEIRDLYNELEIMTNVGYHPNLVNLLGACTEDGHLLVVLEIAENGSLLEFLKKSREPNQNYENIVSGGLTEAMKLRIAIDVARGMAHLASCRCIHRDLAARNVLLGENYVAKVSDYGMARDVYEQLMYKKETQGKLPVKWMAIESLETYIFTVESDVWSFGVLLWEIESGGLKPYAGMNTTELISELKRGYRLEKPNGCSDEMYQVMRDCWDANPKARPSFDQLVIRLENMAVSL